MCGRNCFFIASANTARDCSSGRFLPRRTALIQSEGSVPRPVAPSPEYSRIASPSVVSRNMTLRASSLGGRSLKDRRRSARSQIVSGALTVTTSVTKCTHLLNKEKRLQRTCSEFGSKGHAMGAPCLISAIMKPILAEPRGHGRRRASAPDPGGGARPRAPALG